MLTIENLKQMDIDQQVLATRQVVEATGVPKPTLDGWIVNKRIAIAGRLQVGRGRVRLFSFADGLYLALLRRLLFGGLSLSAADDICERMDLHRSTLMRAVEDESFILIVARNPDVWSGERMEEGGEVAGLEHWYFNLGGKGVGSPGTADLVKMEIPLGRYMRPAAEALLRELSKSSGLL